jgi:hypothetical protein
LNEAKTCKLLNPIGIRIEKGVENQEKVKSADPRRRKSIKINGGFSSLALARPAEAKLMNDELDW